MKKSKVYFFRQDVMLSSGSIHENSHDHFKMTHPDTEWESCLKHAEEIGLGTIEYELKTI